MKIKSFCFIFLIVIISCKENEPKYMEWKEEPRKDTIRSFYDNKVLKEEYIYLNDSVKFKQYFKDGNLQVEGQFYKEQPAGVWKEYKGLENFPMVMSEYSKIKQKSVRNQVIFFNDDGSIDYIHSRFYVIKGDTLEYNTPLDTIPSNILLEKEIKIVANDKIENLLLNKENKIYINDFDYPIFISEWFLIKSDSLIDGENAVRYISNRMIINKENQLIKNN